MRRRVMATIVLGTLGAVSVASAASAPKPVVAHDPKADVRSALDLTRVSLARGADGRLRGSLTLAAAWDGKALVATSGPPGSICLKLWTTAKAPDESPDHLVCVTAAKDGTLRGSVLADRANKLPERIGGADVSRPSTRTVTVRFSQTVIGAPAAVEAAAETTRPGCPRASCVDLAPEGGKTLRLVLRAAG